jgi:2-keto-4-pentenoate hydratase/2-oxohepta-3-ene-1,7-dioic acid hydratase in catechol pathway
LVTPPQWLKVGDVLEAEVEGIGMLRNRIIAPGR